MFTLQTVKNDSRSRLLLTNFVLEALFSIALGLQPKVRIPR